MNILYYDRKSSYPQDLETIYKSIKALIEDGRIGDTLILPKCCDFEEDVSFEEIERLYNKITDIYTAKKLECDENKKRLYQPWPFE